MARRPIFKGPNDRYVATQRIQIVEGTYIEPGEAIPAGTRRATLRRWFTLGMIGPVEHPWTAHLLGRRQRHLEQDKAAKRLHPGGEADLARIAAVLAGKAPPKAAWQPAAPARPVKNGGAQGVSPTKAGKPAPKGAAGAPPPLRPAPPAPGATFGGPLPPPPPPAPAIEPEPTPELGLALDPAAPEDVSDAEPEQQPQG